MKKWLRRIRGAIGVGLTWGVVWGLVGGVLEAVFGLPPGWSGAGIVFQEFVRGFAAFSMVGLMGGGIFSVVLGLEGRRRSFAEMSLPRFGLWGAVAGVAMGTIMFLVISPDLSARFGAVEAILRGAMTVGSMGLIGAGSAAGSLALARRAADNELLAGGDELADIGLTNEEARDLLGA